MSSSPANSASSASTPTRASRSASSSGTIDVSSSAKLASSDASATSSSSASAATASSSSSSSTGKGFKDEESYAVLIEARERAQKQKVETPLYYGTYLQLDKILSAQLPRTRQAGLEAHDEHLFLLIHQVYELWFKQIIFELDSVMAIFAAPHIEERLIGLSVQRLQRIIVIQKILLHQIDVLETMNPLDFLDFRDYLYPASGFQSVQFRLIENKLGLPAATRLSYGSRGYCSYLAEADAATVKASEVHTSLYDLVSRWLERIPFLETETFSFWAHYKQAVENIHRADEDAIKSNPHVETAMRDVQLKELQKQSDFFSTLFDVEKFEASRRRGERRLSLKATQAALLIILYSEEPILSLPHRLITSLVEIDENFTAWRYRHALMVYRQLGSKIGTGGSSGFQYLHATAERHKIFGDLANLSSLLVPRAALPTLPVDYLRALSFSAESLVTVMGGEAEGKVGNTPPNKSRSSSVTTRVTGGKQSPSVSSAPSSSLSASLGLGFALAGGEGDANTSTASVAAASSTTKDVLRCPMGHS